MIEPIQDPQDPHFTDRLSQVGCRDFDPEYLTHSVYRQIEPD